MTACPIRLTMTIMYVLTYIAAVILYLYVEDNMKTYGIFKGAGYVLTLIWTKS